MSTILDFNSYDLFDRPLNVLINQLIDRAEQPGEPRGYLGASLIAAECLRRVQYDWMCDPDFPARTKDIFARGHWGEDLSRRRLIAAGFKFALPEQLEFTAADGLFKGHADGVLLSGPAIPALRYPCVWEHKTLNAKGFRAIDRDGLVGLHAIYAGQVALYQACLDYTNSALFTVLNADTCERLHFLVPFDAALAQAMSDRAVAIIAATRASQLLPRIARSPDDWRCNLCSHSERCWR